MAAAKTEEPPAPPAKGDAAAAAPAVVAVTVTPGAKGALSSWLPVIAAVLLAPVATWVTVEFLVLPRMLKKLSAPAVAAAAPAAAPADGDAKKGEGGKESGPPGYEFSSVVVNLSGTMGTRYLKTSFLVTGSEPNIKAIFEAAKPRLTDVTLNVLSSLSLADLEEPGSKNVIRERLVGAYNQALGKKVAEQVYFSDFVIQ
ncbi:MAG TPA: flagellar basal body-associated FliL family protein [Opitutaceae bacterium]